MIVREIDFWELLVWKIRIEVDNENLFVYDLANFLGILIIFITYYHKRGQNSYVVNCGTILVE